MRAAGLVNFLLTGVCLTPDYEVLKKNNTLKREVELLTDDNQIPQDVCLLPGRNLLAGKKLTIATWQDWPSSGVVKDDNGNQVGTGFAFEFVDILREKFGFSYDIVLPEDNILGDANRGIFGLLHSKKVDMAAALLPVTPTTMKLATPSVSLGETEFVILMKRPTASATGSGLLAPFTTEVWYLILVSLVLVGPVICVIIKTRNYLVRRKRPLLVPAEPFDPEPEDYSLSSCVWFVYGALMKQGSTLSPRTDSTRMLFATWWLFILVLTAYYTANLTAFLTLSKFTLPITGPKDIPKNWKWFAEQGRILENAIMNETYLPELSRPVWFEQLPYVNETRQQRILELVDNERIVFLEEKRKVEYLIFRQYVRRTSVEGKKEMKEKKDTQPCKLAMTPQSFMAHTLAFFYPYNSSLVKLFDKTLISLLEAGIVKHQQRRALPLNQICPLDLNNKERQLRNEDLMTTYQVIASGFVAAIAAFCAEFVMQRWHRQRAKQRAASAQRKLLGTPVERTPVPNRKRVRLKIPMGPRYPGDVSHVLVLPPGHDKLMGHKAQFYPANAPSPFIFR